MKKKILTAVLMLGMLVSLAGCSKKFTCGICGEEKTGKSHTEKFLGEKLTICDDCYKDIQALGSLFK